MVLITSLFSLLSRLVSPNFFVIDRNVCGKMVLILHLMQISELFRHFLLIHSLEAVLAQDLLYHVWIIKAIWRDISVLLFFFYNFSGVAQWSKIIQKCFFFQIEILFLVNLDSFLTCFWSLQISYWPLVIFLNLVSIFEHILFKV